MTDESAVPYRDDDFVYVDPEKREVVGRVEWGRSGNPKSLPVPDGEGEEKDARHPSKKRSCPWGSFRSVRRVFRIGGKAKEVPSSSLDEALTKAQAEPYWD